MQYNEGFTCFSEGGTASDLEEILGSFERFWDLNGIALSKHPELWADGPDTAFFNSNGTVSRSVAEWLDGFASYEPNLRVIDPPSISELRVTIRGNLAVVVAPAVHRSFEWSRDLADAQPSHSNTVRATFVYRRVENGWRAVHTHFSHMSEGARPWAPLPEHHTGSAGTERSA